MPPASAALPRRSSLETWSVRALLITLVAAAVVALPAAWFPLLATKSSLLALGALVTLALFVLARLSRGSMVLPPLALVGALWLPAAAYLLSAAFSGTSFGNAFWGRRLEPDTVGFMMVAALLGTLAAFLLRRPEHYRMTLRTFAGAALLVALVEVLVITLGQVAPAVILPTYSFVGSPTDLAAVLGLAVVGTLITLRFLDVSARARQFFVVLGAVALLVLMVLNISLVWVLLALVSLGLFVEAVMQRRSPDIDADLDIVTVIDEAPVEGESGSHSVALPLAVLAVSLFFLIGGALAGALADALHVSTLDVRPSWQSTLAAGQQTYASSPIFGSGPGTFGSEWLKHRDPALNSTIFWNIDFTSGIGFVPTSFVTTGLAGVLAWVLLFALFLVLGLRMLILRASTDPFMRYAAILSFVATAYLFTIAVVNVPGPLVLALAFVFAGIFASTMRSAVGGTQWGVIFARSPRVGFVIVFLLTLLLLASVVAAYGLLGRYVAGVELARASAAYATGDLDAADRSVGNSLSFAPSPAAYRLQASVSAARLGQIISSTTLSVSSAQQAFQVALSSGINAALAAARLEPDSYENWVLLGNMYAEAVPLGVSAAYESALSAYTRAAELNPTNPQIPYTLAQLAVANRDLKAAEEQLKAAIALKQDYAAAILLLSQLQVQQGNVRDALDSALAAAYFMPNDPAVLFQVGVLEAAAGDLPKAADVLRAAVAANPQFANARYFLAAVYAKQGDFANAAGEMEAIAALSVENANAVAAQLSELRAGRNPFPANLLSVSPPAPAATR